MYNLEDVLSNDKKLLLSVSACSIYLWPPFLVLLSSVEFLSSFSTLGFVFHINQPALVNTLKENINVHVKIQKICQEFCTWLSTKLHTAIDKVIIELNKSFSFVQCSTSDY